MAALPVIPQDKANHFVYGAAISLVAGVLANKFDLAVPVYSIAAAVLFGLFKEAFDYYQNWMAVKKFIIPVRGVEVADFFATALGGVAVNALLILHKGI